MRFRDALMRIPVVGTTLVRLNRILRGHRLPFPGSAAYWEGRYAAGRTSGHGSYGQLAAFKAEVLNEFIAANRVRRVIEFGCGDGHQLCLAEYPHYVGYDVSDSALALCRDRFARDDSKRFARLDEYAGENADLALSLDVIYHLIEDEVFEKHMRALFAAASRFVIIYSSDRAITSGCEASHVRHREFTAWVRKNAPKWRLVTHLPNRYRCETDSQEGSRADFYIYEFDA